MIKEEVREHIKNIAEKFKVEKVILFGSYARGTETSRSDLDLIFIKETKERFLFIRPRNLKKCVNIVFLLKGQGLSMSREKQSHEALRWFRQAKADLETSRILKENNRFSGSCFWAHQGAEKALKAAWFSLDKEPWGHSLQKLVEDLREKELYFLREDGLPYPLIPEETIRKKMQMRH